MPKVSSESAPHVEDFGVAEDRHGELGEYTVNFVTTQEDQDLAPLLKGLPEDRCQCPHWGYVFEGRLIWRYADHEEIVEAGDAFYAPPGHTPVAEAGSRFLTISPTDALRVSEEAMQRNAQAMQSA